MRRTMVVTGLLFLAAAFLPLRGVCQSQQPASDPAAIALAQQATTALTGRNRVADVTLQADVVSNMGSESENGTGTFQARTTGDSRISLSMSKGTRNEVRATRNGIPTGKWQRNGEQAKSHAQHNCLTDSVWFFPALSWLTQTSEANLSFKFVGVEPRGGVDVEHIQISKTSADRFGDILARLSRTDYYLDPSTKLPVVIVYRVHPDRDSNTDIVFEIQLDQYRSINGVQVPFHFKEVLNGASATDVTVTNVTLNSGLADSLFDLQ